MTEPLVRQEGKGVELQWLKKNVTAFQTVKKYLTESPLADVVSK